MKKEELLDHVKAALRITSDDVGIISEIKMLIESAKSDLKLSGIKATALDGETIDEIIVLAITTYCKSKFGFDNPESEKLYESYKTLEIHLSLSKEYREEQASEV